jgi:8-oxo-dGTP pyrophosphatase MutT (NUDIX family)
MDLSQLYFSKTFTENNIDLDSSTAMKRIAVRGIVVNDGKLLVVHSQLKGDYKLPGGGKKEGETELLALQREIGEECGVLVDGEAFVKVGEVLQYKSSIEKEIDVFINDSRYYFCDVSEIGYQDVARNLDDYEDALGFEAMWLEIDEIWAVQKTLLRKKDSTPNKWIRREFWVFDMLKNHKKEFLLK